eukprot:10953033-Heterocapsa_arctica.AAC.1
MRLRKNTLHNRKEQRDTNTMEGADPYNMFKQNTISAPHDKSYGSAITSELRTQHNMLSSMKKYNVLIRKGAGNTEGFKTQKVDTQL